MMLVDNALNDYLNGVAKDKERENKIQGFDQHMTIDVNFSPTKHTRKRLRSKKNKRTLVITGSSPYL